MHKNGIKNFIYSFMLSLFAVFLVNKAVFRVSDKTGGNTSSAAVANMTKQSISLFSVPADIAKAVKTGSDNTIDVSEIDKIAAPALKVAVSAEEHASPSVKTAGETASHIDTGIEAAEEIVLEKENFIVRHESQPDYEKSGIVYADISDTTADEQKQHAPDAKVIYFAEDATADVSLATAEPVKEETPVRLAAADTPEIVDNNDIPLQENSETLYTQVDVRQSAGNTRIAMLEPNNLVSNIEDPEAPEEKTLAEADLKQNEWTQMSDKTENSPWVVAKGNKFAKNKAVVEQFADSENTASDGNTPDVPAEPETASLRPETLASEGEESKVAYQMIQNLLIPIPEDIMNDSNLTPQLSVTPKEKNAAQKDDDQEKNKDKNTKKLDDKDKQSSLFKSIASWFSSDNKQDKKSQTKTSSGKKPASSGKSGFDFFGLSLNEENSAAPQILPAELRLSFQPNRAEISGQTLRWIHAFADNARDNDNLYIEIRIDGTSSFALQKKRLNLLSTILANRGVDFRKINIVFTSREPNSFIIRNIRFNNEEERAGNKNNANSYYQPW